MAKRFFGRKIEVKEEGKEPDEKDFAEHPPEEAAAEDRSDQSEGDTVEMDAVEEAGEQGAAAGPDLEKEGDPLESKQPDSIVEQLKSELNEARDRYLRAVAELENVQKRNAKERSELLRYAGQQLAADLVEVVDDMERAAQQDAKVGVQEMLKGIQLIRDRFLSVLERHSVRGSDTIGKPFDPNVHEALASVPTADYDEGTVIEQLKKAYFFKDKLLRPAQVVVAVAPPEEEKEKDDPDLEEEASEGSGS